MPPEQSTADADDLLVRDLDAGQLAELMAAGRTTSAALTRACLARIARLDHDSDGGAGLHAVLRLNPAALSTAAALDEERRSGAVRGPLHGIPVVVKDNYDLVGLPATAGSAALRGRLPLRNATQVARLLAAGVVVVGKTNMDELASGATGLSSLGGQTRNPHDTDRYPGGSSGGTAAAVAAGLAVLGLGSDTGGSIRIPAAHNGVVGLRSSLGLLSRFGICPESETQDIGGPIARTVRDVALAMDALALPGPDAADRSTADPNRAVPKSYLEQLRPDALSSSRIGVLRDFFGDRPQHESVNSIIDAAVADIARLGANVIHLPRQPALIAALDDSAVLDHEFVRDLNQFLSEVPYHGSPELQALAARTEPRDRVTLDDIIASGEVVPSVQRLLIMRTELAHQPDFHQQYQHHLAQRSETKRLLDELMSEYQLDAVVFPCQQLPAAVIGTHQDGYYPSGLSSNTGWPALTVPAGLTADSLPVGIEFLSRPYSEALLLGLGYAYEQATRHRVSPRHS